MHRLDPCQVRQLAGEAPGGKAADGAIVGAAGVVVGYLRDEKLERALRPVGRRQKKRGRRAGTEGGQGRFPALRRSRERRQNFRMQNFRNGSIEAVTVRIIWRTLSPVVRWTVDRPSIPDNVLYQVYILVKLTLRR